LLMKVSGDEYFGEIVLIDCCGNRGWRL
jgi:hypothetical protein